MTGRADLGPGPHVVAAQVAVPMAPDDPAAIGREPNGAANTRRQIPAPDNSTRIRLPHDHGALAVRGDDQPAIRRKCQRPYVRPMPQPGTPDPPNDAIAIWFAIRVARQPGPAGLPKRLVRGQCRGKSEDGRNGGPEEGRHVELHFQRAWIAAVSQWHEMPGLPTPVGAEVGPWVCQTRAGYPNGPCQTGRFENARQDGRLS